ncbi:MAG: response regulator transcription factor, partial [Trebonia sp.]
MTGAAAASAPPGRAVRILVVDDHTIVRQGLRSILDLEPDFTVVGEAATPAEAMAQADRLRPDVV